MLLQKRFLAFVSNTNIIYTFDKANINDLSLASYCIINSNAILINYFYDHYNAAFVEIGGKHKVLDFNIELYLSKMNEKSYNLILSIMNCLYNDDFDNHILKYCFKNKHFFNALHPVHYLFKPMYTDIKEDYNLLVMKAALE